LPKPPKKKFANGWSRDRGDRPAAPRSQTDECPVAVGGGEPLREERPVHEVVARLRAPPDAGLVVHGAERIADVGIRETGVRGREVADVNRHVLVLGQAIEVARHAAVDVEVESARLVEDERRVVPEPEAIALAAGLRRAEQIVEIGVVQVEAGAPVVALVQRGEVNPLGVGQPARAHRRGD
jgi:hypothetical protein